MINNKEINSKDLILTNLINNQKDIKLDKKLTYFDLKRISANLNKDIFTDECSLWNGSITNINNQRKNNYISFFFKNKKVALHRLLYCNYIEDLSDNEYIKFNCDNKGRCCNINHFSKSCLKTQNKYYIKSKNQKRIKNEESNNNYQNIISDNENKNIVSF